MMNKTCHYFTKLKSHNLYKKGLKRLNFNQNELIFSYHCVTKPSSLFPKFSCKPIYIENFCLNLFLWRCFMMTFVRTVKVCSLLVVFLANLVFLSFAEAILLPFAPTEGKENADSGGIKACLFGKMIVCKNYVTPQYMQKINLPLVK